MSIYTFRILFNSSNEDPIYRELEIESDANFEILHKAICKAFEITPNDLASIFITNDKWENETEITLTEMGNPDAKLMNKTAINELITEKGQKFVYLYDYLLETLFFAGLTDIKERETNKVYPFCTKSKGQIPASELEPKDVSEDILKEAEDIDEQENN